MSKNAFAAAAALSMMMAGSSAMAGTSGNATTPFTVQVQINDGCTVNTSGTVSLSGVSGVLAKTMDTPQSNTGRVTATCTSGTQYGLKLTSTNNGAAADGKYYMKGSSGNLVTIPYTVKYTSFSGTGASTNLTPDAPINSGTATATRSFTSGGADTIITLTFTSGTPSGPLTRDTYSDIVNVTAEF